MSESAWLDRALAEFLADGQRGLAGLECFCRACTEALRVDGTAVSVFADAGRELVCATDETVAKLDEAQYTLGEGPYIDAQTAEAPVLVPDLTRSEGARWPAFTPSALEMGVHALFGFPLQLGAIRIGVLALYRRSSGPLERRELAAALRATDVAAWMLIRQEGDDRVADSDAQGWEESPWVRIEVSQATGMIMAQLGVSAEEAFARLRAYAFAQERRVGDVAADVVAKRLRFDQAVGDAG